MSPCSCSEWRAGGPASLASAGELLEVGLAALVERAHAFLRFLGLVVVLDQLDAKEADAADAFAVGVERALADRQRRRAHLVDLLAPLVDLGVELGVGDDLVDQAHLLGFGRAVLPAQEPDLAGL